jgi:hypothetical protein
VIRRSGVLGLGVALALALVITGCQSDEPTGPDMTSTIDAAEVRTDRQPIADRFPRLGSFVDAHWVGGRLGDDRVPGPSTYFIEAVVTLSPDDVARLTGEYDFAPAPAAPQAPQSLNPFVEGGGPWSTSSELESGFGPADWVSEVFVRLDEGVAYVSARGE